MGCTTSKPDQLTTPYYNKHPSSSTSPHISSPKEYVNEPNHYNSNNSASISDDMQNVLEELEHNNNIERHTHTHSALHTNGNFSIHGHIKAEQVKDVGNYIHSLDEDHLGNSTTPRVKRISTNKAHTSFVKKLFFKRTPTNSTFSHSSQVLSQQQNIVSTNASSSFSTSSYELALKELADVDPSLGFSHTPHESLASDHLWIHESARTVSSTYERALRELDAELEPGENVINTSTLAVKLEQQTDASNTSPRSEPTVESLIRRKRKALEDPLARFVELCPPGGEGSVVLYTTSLRGIRKTFEDCNNLRRVLESLFVHVDERDVALHEGFRNELKVMMQGPTFVSIPMSVPRLFINGRYIGGAEEVLQLHEEEKLLPLLDGIPREQSSGQPCDGCGGVRFVPCLNCSGSRKVVHPHTQVVIRCPECNENGLMQCPICN